MPTFVPIVPRAQLLDREAVIAALTGAVRDMQAEGLRWIAEYPPQRQPAHYRRTGTLKRSWSMPPVYMTGNMIAGEIGSNAGVAPYNDPVQGPAQTFFFADRAWRSVAQLQAKVEAEMPIRAQRAIDRAAGV
jgi:hypothetical protein